MLTREKDCNLDTHGITGLALVPLLLWFLVSLMTIIQDPFNSLPVFFYSPVNVVFGVLFTCIVMHHLDFDVKYLINFSIKNEKISTVLCLFFDAFSIVTTMTMVLSILQLHFVGIIIS